MWRLRPHSGCAKIIEPRGDASLRGALHHFRFLASRAGLSLRAWFYARRCMLSNCVLIRSGHFAAAVCRKISIRTRVLAGLALVDSEGGSHVRWRHAPSVGCCSAHSDDPAFRAAPLRDNAGLRSSQEVPVIERTAASRQRLHRATIVCLRVWTSKPQSQGCEGAMRWLDRCARE